jgi:predicted GNAT family N-acyltransferase
MKTEVNLIANAEDLDLAHRIRFEVFVEEQHVPATDELDAYEAECRHFLARDEAGVPCGTARWRRTPLGIKLERFAVIRSHRGRGVGSALMRTVMSDIAAQPGTEGRLLYLHAQLDAMPLYSKFGFVPTGPMFEECAIRHYKMILPG